MRHTKQITYGLALVACLALLPGCDEASDGSALQKVNGSVHVLAGTAPSDAETVNGSISLADDVVVGGPVTNVNGKISLKSAQLGGGITTVNGDVSIYGASHVAGGIHVEKPGGVIQLGASLPRIEIGPGATVQGELKFDREVRLYVSDKATIGPVTGATAIPFTGDAAPRD